jgi:hypothetical protein
MERLGKPRHRREGQRLSERGMSESNPVVKPEGSPGEIYFCFSSHSFWKRGSERKGSQYGWSLRRAGVTLAAT